MSPRIARQAVQRNWWTEILVGVGLLIWASARLQRAQLVGVAVGVSTVIAVVFVMVFRLNLIALFP